MTSITRERWLRSAPPLAMAAAVWPLWPWLWARTIDPSGEPWGLVAAAAAVALFGMRLRAARDAWHPAPHLLAGAGGILLLYVLGWQHVPRLLLCAASMVALGLTLLAALSPETRRRSHGLVALLLLSLPWAPSLDFYAGYPLRVATGSLAAGSLDLGGLQAVRDGAGLIVQGHSIFVDPACSGLRFMTTALMLVALVGSWRGMRWPALGVHMTWACGLAVVANAWRSAALALAEVRLMESPPMWFHSAVGLLVFVILVSALERTTVPWSSRPRSAL